MLNSLRHAKFPAVGPGSLAVALLLGACFGFAQNRVLHEGLQPYVPSRLEWLALEMNSTMRVDLSESNGFAMDFVESEEDTILIYVTYLPGVRREVMNRSVETAKKIIRRESDVRGWSSWLKVQERVVMKETPN
jgi:hypothetical protein